jgi:hypothetical protein
MPIGVIIAITSIRRRFLWCGFIEARKISKVSWHVVVRDMKRGRLGVGSIEGKNKALLFKWLWRLSDQHDRGWHDVINRKY